MSFTCLAFPVRYDKCSVFGMDGISADQEGSSGDISNEVRYENVEQNEAAEQKRLEELVNNCKLVVYPKDDQEYKKYLLPFPIDEKEDFTRYVTAKLVSDGSALETEGVKFDDLNSIVKKEYFCNGLEDGETADAFVKRVFKKQSFKQFMDDCDFAYSKVDNYYYPKATETNKALIEDAIAGSKHNALKKKQTSERIASRIQDPTNARNNLEGCNRLRDLLIEMMDDIEAHASNQNKWKEMAVMDGTDETVVGILLNFVHDGYFNKYGVKLVKDECKRICGRSTLMKGYNEGAACFRQNFIVDETHVALKPNTEEFTEEFINDYISKLHEQVAQRRREAAFEANVEQRRSNRRREEQSLEYTPKPQPTSAPLTEAAKRAIAEAQKRKAMAAAAAAQATLSSQQQSIQQQQYIQPPNTQQQQQPSYQTPLVQNDYGNSVVGYGTNAGIFQPSPVSATYGSVPQPPMYQTSTQVLDTVPNQYNQSPYTLPSSSCAPTYPQSYYQQESTIDIQSMPTVSHHQDVNPIVSNQMAPPTVVESTVSHIMEATVSHRLQDTVSDVAESTVSVPLEEGETSGHDGQEEDEMKYVDAHNDRGSDDDSDDSLCDAAQYSDDDEETKKNAALNKEKKMKKLSSNLEIQYDENRQSTSYDNDNETIVDDEITPIPSTSQPQQSTVSEKTTVVTTPQMTTDPRLSAPPPPYEEPSRYNELPPPLYRVPEPIVNRHRLVAQTMFQDQLRTDITQRQQQQPMNTMQPSSGDVEDWDRLDGQANAPARLQGQMQPAPYVPANAQPMQQQAPPHQQAPVYAPSPQSMQPMHAPSQPMQPTNIPQQPMQPMNVPQPPPKSHQIQPSSMYSQSQSMNAPPLQPPQQMVPSTMYNQQSASTPPIPSQQMTPQTVYHQPPHSMVPNTNQQPLQNTAPSGNQYGQPAYTPQPQSSTPFNMPQSVSAPQYGAPPSSLTYQMERMTVQEQQVPPPPVHQPYQHPPSGHQYQQHQGGQSYGMVQPTPVDQVPSYSQSSSTIPSNVPYQGHQGPLTGQIQYTPNQPQYTGQPQQPQYQTYQGAPPPSTGQYVPYAPDRQSPISNPSIPLNQGRSNQMSASHMEQRPKPLVRSYFDAGQNPNPNPNPSGFRDESRRPRRERYDDDVSEDGYHPHNEYERDENTRRQRRDPRTSGPNNQEHQRDQRPAGPNNQEYQRRDQRTAGPSNQEYQRYQRSRQHRGYQDDYDDEMMDNDGRGEYREDYVDRAAMAKVSLWMQQNMQDFRPVTSSTPINRSIDGDVDNRRVRRVVPPVPSYNPYTALDAIEDGPARDRMRHTIAVILRNHRRTNRGLSPTDGPIILTEARLHNLLVQICGSEYDLFYALENSDLRSFLHQMYREGLCMIATKFNIEIYLDPTARIPSGYMEIDR